MEDRYGAVIKLVNQMSADGFYCIFNGKKFSPAEVCKIMLDVFLYFSLCFPLSYSFL